MNWSQDQIQWTYSKNSAERVLRSTTSANKHIPALPMYVQMSIWPGGEAAAPGTVKWAGEKQTFSGRQAHVLTRMRISHRSLNAGGKINWNDARFKQAGGQFQFIIKSVTIECGDDHPFDYAYKYIRNNETNNKLSFKAVKLEGYGVSQVPTPVLQVQPGANVNVRPAYEQAQQPEDASSAAPNGPSRLPSSVAAEKQSAAGSQVSPAAS